MRFFIIIILLLGAFFAFENIIPPVIISSQELTVNAPEASPIQPPQSLPKSATTTPEVLPVPEEEVVALVKDIVPIPSEIPVVPENIPLIPPQKAYVSSTLIREYTVNSIVNLLCTVAGNRAISATGIIVSAEGHILSNAHVGADLERPECLIRIGSPAKNLAYADLLFIPQKYTEATTDFTRARYDVSIWKIARPVGNTPLPEIFEALTIDYETSPKSGDQFAVFSYPAEVFGFQTILKSLTLLFTNTEVVSFGEYFIETINSLSSQKGSSGGALIDRETLMLRGLIFGVSGDELAADRKLFSLRPDWISGVIKEETGLSLQEYLAQ